MQEIVVVDDEKSVLEMIEHALESSGFLVTGFQSADDALDYLKTNKPALLITDIRMSEMSGFDLLDKVKAIYPELNIVLITAHASVETAIDALRRGAFDFLTKPFKIQELRDIVKRSLSERKFLGDSSGVKTVERPIIGSSEKMQAIMSTVDKVAPTDSTVLIFGESGTGKELVARAIHARSKRKENAFISINCSALPDTLLESELFGHEKGSFTGAIKTKKGLIEASEGGTLFLDEIGDISQAVQVKLLRVLQEREIMRVGGLNSIPVNVRILAATSRNLPKMVDEEKFREDLYFRLNVIPIKLPPLRERSKDIPVLIEHFRSKFNQKLNRNISIDKEAVKILEKREWRGNIRELENLLERSFALCEGDRIDAAFLEESASGKEKVKDSGNIGGISQLKAETESIEKETLKRALENTEGNKKRAAESLGMSRQSFAYKIKKYNIE